MTAEVAGGDAVEIAAGRARAAARRRRPGSAEWPVFAPPVALSPGPLGAAQAADREIARQTAVRARAVAEFAAARPASVDRAPGEPGAMSPDRWAARPPVLRGVSEWAGQELAVALSLSVPAAEGLLARSLTLVHRLPGTLAALAAGALHPGHLWPLLEHVAPIEDDTLRAEVEAGLLRWAAGRVTTPAQLGDKARREVARCDARAAARRLEKALRRRGVHLSSAAPDGLAAVTALLTEPEALVFYRALGGYADQIPDDPEHPRTREQKMADCLLDLVLRPGGVDLVQVQILLTVVASVGTLAGGDEVGEVDGRVVPAAMIRELIRLLGPQVEAQPQTEPEAQPQTEPEPEPEADVAGEAPSPDSADAVAWQHGDPDELEAWWTEEEQRVLAERGDPDSEPIADTAGPAGPADAGVLGRRTTPAQLADWASSPVGMTWLVEQEEPDRWWTEMEQRVLAFELGQGPDWEGPNGLTPDDPDRTAGPGPSPGRGDARAGGWRDRRPSDPPAPPGREPPDPETSDADGGGWWAAADRAVDAASRVLLELDRAAGHAGRLVAAAVAADAADEDAAQAAGARLTHAADALQVLQACSQAQRARLSALLSATGGGGLVDRPRIALTDAVTGALLALTDLPALRRTGHCGTRACRRHPAACRHDLTGRPGLGPPGPTDGYRPAARLDRFLRARDRRCRQPGCRRPVPQAGELDHNRPHPLGPTSAGNLTGYCTGHHRGKHQAPGWRHTLQPDGTLTVTTPTGLTATTTPPPFSYGDPPF